MRYERLLWFFKTTSPKTNGMTHMAGCVSLLIETSRNKHRMNEEIPIGLRADCSIRYGLVE